MTDHPRRNPIARHPAEESIDLYPGLCVDDERVSGSITAGRSRLPLWALIGTMMEEGWDEVVSEDSWPELNDYGWTKQSMSDFLYYLTQPRGEFARLMLVIANAERLTDSGNIPPAEWEPWHAKADIRQQVKEQLQRCIDALAAVEERP